MDKDKIDVIVYSESLSFIKMLTESGYLDQDINLKCCVNSIAELIRIGNIPEDAIIAFYTYSMSASEIDSIIEYFESISASFFAVCDEANLGFELMKKGALCVVMKNSDDTKYGHMVFCRWFSRKVKDAYDIRRLARVRTVRKKIYVNSDKVIAIGSSTGGTEAIVEILKKMPEASPPILIVQHMPPVFTKMFADRLNNICDINVWEAKDGDKLEPGLALLAPGDYQMKIVAEKEGFSVRCFKGERVNGFAPSVDVLFKSVAENIGEKAVGIILTGMGDDGSKGLLEMKKRGAYTIGQDEKSSIVYGMPKVAFDIGAVKEQIALSDIAKRLKSLI